ncbi:MAG: non-homologous end-joining DNA ligase [Actinomycetota bacterium]|nr:non-homologous end-joining DNA ligase [Actinomycetota bacterium]
MSPSSPKVRVEVEGRELTLSNLDKVMYPEVGFTKGQVLDYYTRIAPVILPYLRNRPLTFKRYPDGVDGKFFFEKNAPKHKPDWVPTVEIATPGSTKNRESINFAVVCELPTLVWAANLATLEMHIPMWTVGPRGGVRGADLMVYDLDPGPPATIVECCKVAVLLREILAGDGMAAWAKTSGSKGMQLYVPLQEVDPERTWSYARELAQRMERDHPDLVVWKMSKALRPGKVLVDWSQNSATKTTIAVYSMRARPRPTVSTPISWDEVEACARPEDLVFVSDDVLARVDRLGDLFAPLLTSRQRLP